MNGYNYTGRDIQRATADKVESLLTYATFWRRAPRPDVRLPGALDFLAEVYEAHPEHRPTIDAHPLADAVTRRLRPRSQWAA